MKHKGNASLDRIDSTRGYVEGNLQWVDKVFQKMKRVMSDADFIHACRRVSAHHPIPAEYEAGLGAGLVY